MKKFKCMKKLDFIKEEAEKQGWKTDFSGFDEGSDWFLLYDHEKRHLNVLVNCFGRFRVFKEKEHKLIATEGSELDDEEWYDEILELLYVK